MLHEHIDEMVERGIVEELALLHQRLEETLIVVSHYLVNDRQVSVLRLQEHQSALPLASCSSAHLSHHHEGVLIGTEVGIVEHRVGIQYAHHAHVVKVEPLAYHLRADKNVGLSCRKLAYQSFVGVARAGGVEVHCHACLRKQFAYQVFNLLRSEAAASQIRALTVGTHLWHGVSVATIVAGHQVRVLVQRQADVTVFTFRHPSAHVTLYHRREAPSVLEQDDLFLLVQRLSHGSQQIGRERPAHDLAVAQVLHVHHPYLWQLNALVACGELHQAILARGGVIVALRRWCGGAEQRLRPIHRSQHNGSRPCMVAWGRVLLLERRLVLLVNDHQS